MALTGSKDNIVNVWQQATDWEIHDGSVYYYNLRSRIIAVGDRYKFRGITELAAMFAALSPNNDEAGNFRDLAKILVAYNNSSGPPAVSSYPANAMKAYCIACGAMPEEELGGKKVISFWKNISDPSDEHWVTVDGHMASVWHGKRLLLKARRNPDLPYAVITSRDYDVISSNIRTVAKSFCVVSTQFQSTLWLTWKRMNNIRYNPQLKLWE